MSSSYSGSGSGQLGQGGVNITAGGNAPQGGGLGVSGVNTVLTPTDISFGWAFLYTERLGAAAEMAGVASHTNYQPVSGFLLPSGERLVDKQTPFREEVRMLLLQANDPRLIQRYIQLSQARDEGKIAELRQQLVAGLSEKDRLDIKRSAMVSFVNKQAPEVQGKILEKAMIEPADFVNYASANIQERSKKQTVTNFVRAGALFFPQLWEQGQELFNTTLNFGRIKKSIIEQEPGGRYVRGAGPKEIVFGEKQAKFRLSRDAAFRGTFQGFSEAKAKLFLPAGDLDITQGLHVDGLNAHKKQQTKIMKPNRA